MDKRYSYADEDGNTWYCKIDDEYKPDRDKFIIDNFKTTFGEILEIKVINELVSRSAQMKIWYSDVISKYILEVDLPQYFANKIKPEEYNSIQKKIALYNDLNKKESIEKQKISDEYKAKITKIEDSYKADKSKVMKDPLVRILTINKEELPINLQLKLISYSPKEENDPRTAALYGREMLVRYKIELLELHSAGVDVDQVIIDRQSKL